jgi:hypothetical protein
MFGRVIVLIKVNEMTSACHHLPLGTPARPARIGVFVPFVQFLAVTARKSPSSKASLR